MSWAAVGVGVGWGAASRRVRGVGVRLGLEFFVGTVLCCVGVGELVLVLVFVSVE